jgi:aminopeptidase
VSDSRLARLAEVLVGYSTRVEPGQVVLIEGPTIAEPLVYELYRETLRAGAHPLLRLAVDGMADALLLEGSEQQVSWVNPRFAEDVEQADVRIAIYATRNTKSLTNADPALQARFHLAHEPLQQRFLERAANGKLRWVITAFPNDAHAQDAGMSRAEYDEFVYRASFLDRDDPVGEWKQFSERLERLASYLASKRELRIVAEGTDLTVGVGDRRWIASYGRENFPDGEVFTGPVEDGVDGTVRFSFPAVFHGREVDDVRLRFERGEVVEATAARGQDFLEQMIAMDEGARRLGEFAFGMNEAIDVFTRNILFDEKLGGTVHMALGSAYPETGGVNRSGLHWDMICDLRTGSEVYADEEVVYRDGAFLAGLF